MSTASFPFAEAGYLVHIGRGTLRRIASAQHQDNRYFSWAMTHNTPHYGEWPDAAERHRAFLELFEDEVGELTAEALVAACRRRELVRLS